METKNHTSLKVSFWVVLSVLMCVLFSFMFPSCQWVGNNRDFFFFTGENDKEPYGSVIPYKDPVLYWGHRIFTFKEGKLLNETVTISGTDLVNFEGCLHLKIKVHENRISQGNQPSFRIDGNEVVFPGDLITRDSVITKEICGKSKDFTLEVRHQGELGSRMEVWIEGIMKNPVTDPRDGNKYPWVKIGSQIWMAKNMAYLPSVNQPSDSSRVKERYYVYNYFGTVVNEAKTTTSYSTFGVYYNWLAAMAGADTSNAIPSGVHGVCPEGWHLPSWGEWMVLKNFLWDNGYGYEGNRYYVAKSIAAKTNWDVSGNPGAIGNNPVVNNSTGFSALPAGFYSEGDPYFHYIGKRGQWWSSTEAERSQDNMYIWYYNLCLSSGSYGTGTCNTVVWLGQSVRCIRNY